MDPIIRVEDLVKRFPGVAAVAGVSFAVAAGRCFGLLGPNGAGKTTTIEIMEGITRPTSGAVLYRGEPLGARFRAEAGIQFQKTALQDYLTVAETLKLFQRFYDRTLPLEELVRVCRLESFLDRDTRKISGGQRQRLLLAIALVNDPDILFLDEPTTGLDPQSRRNFWDLVNLIKARGKTLLLTTHYMEEAYHLCDEIAIMDNGRIIAQGTPEALLKKHFNDVVLQLPRAAFGQPLEGFPLPLSTVEDRVEMQVSDLDAAIRQLLAQGISLAQLRIRPRTLDDLFLELTGRELRA
ncbi:MAG: ABC transporter ATP-binding protein [Pseudomonadota bacterium]|nr:ABC transporter ATP-binding protein [Pseudomonadota bacterium]